MFDVDLYRRYELRGELNMSSGNCNIRFYVSYLSKTLEIADFFKGPFHHCFPLVLRAILSSMDTRIRDIVIVT